MPMDIRVLDYFRLSSFLCFFGHLPIGSNKADSLRAAFAEVGKKQLPKTSFPFLRDLFLGKLRVKPRGQFRSVGVQL